ncbi:MAG TPA: class I SAM-dependent methyltransferase [Rhizomicrobium sp.]|nr:class I SAM-dependent methyltransferase [Rhizomicrobium sp.]
MKARPTPFDFIQKATRRHRLRHWCSAYAFKDGAGLIDIARRYSPARIVELGTALGFTACCLASCGKAVRVDTIEGDPRHAALAQSNIEAAGLAERITVHLGRFEDVLRSLPGRYDMAFFDGGPPSIPIIEQLHTLLGDDGVLICANQSRASAGQARDLKREFDNADRWLRVGAIEDGGTLVFHKAERGA